MLTRRNETTTWKFLVEYFNIGYSRHVQPSPIWKRPAARATNLVCTKPRSTLARVQGVIAFILEHPQFVESYLQEQDVLWGNFRKEIAGPLLQ